MNNSPQNPNKILPSSNNNFYQPQYFQQQGPSYPYNYLNNGQQIPYQHSNQNQYWNFNQHQHQHQQQPVQTQNFYQQNSHFQPQNSKYQPQTQHQHQQYMNQGNQFNKNFYNRNQNNFQKNNNQNFQNKKNYTANTNNSIQSSNPNQNNRNFNNNNNESQSQSQKSKKANKRDLPENNTFYCEVCDRGFKTDDKYKEHCATHTTCNVNGCKFTAATKLVEIHFRNFHATGLDKKIPNLQTPEDVQKYINERKKNFPSQTNLEKLAELDKEKSSRGISLNTQQFGKFKNKKRNFDHKNKDQNDKVQLKNDDDDDIGMEEEEEEGEGDTKIAENKKFDRTKLKFKKRKNNKKNGLFQRKSEVLKNRYKKPTLLQKLLADEIRHERNIILQCVRYVVQNDFFDQASIKQESPQKP